MMACVADEVIAAPFAIVGSIGVVSTIPNANRALKAAHIDVEMLAGEFKHVDCRETPRLPEGTGADRGDP